MGKIREGQREKVIKALLVKNMSHLIREKRLLKIRKCIFIWNELKRK